MKYIGIDVGERKSGIAVSDDGGVLAFPKKVVETEKLIESIKEFDTKHVVLGESKDLCGKDNKIMVVIEKLKSELMDLGYSVHMQSELFTTKEAKRFGRGRDDEAAAIILQSFLDRK